MTPGDNAPITWADLNGLCPECRTKTLYLFEKGLTTDSPQFACTTCGDIYSEQAIMNWRGEMMLEHGPKDPK